MNPIIQSASSQRLWNSLFKKAQQGSACAIEKLFDMAEPEIRQMAKSYSPRYCCIQDFYAEGCETYMNLVTNQKESVKRAKNYILKYIRMQMKQMRDKIRHNDKRFISVDDFKFSEDEKKLCLAKKYGYKGWTSPRQADAFMLKEVLDYISKLPEKTKTVLTEIFIKGNSGIETAAKTGLSVDNVFQIVSRERKLLKKWAEL